MEAAPNAVQGTINENTFTVTTSNFIGTIPSGEQNLYGTILLLKKYNTGDYEYIPLGGVDLNESNIDDSGYTARFNAHPYSYSSEKAFGFLGLAIPSVTRVIAALTEAVYLSNRLAGEYYIYDDKLWLLLDNDLTDIYPNETSGNWVLVDEKSSTDLLNLFESKLVSQYEYYYDNFMLIAPCRTETWTHSQACVNGKVVVSGTSNLGHTYGPTTTTMDCDLNEYNYSLECREGMFYIIRHNVTDNTYDYFPTSYSCDTSSRTPDYYSEMICSENCKPNVWQAVMRDHNDPDFERVYETNIECCNCDDTPTSEVVCDEGNGTLRINVLESSCGGFYSVLTDIPCVSIPDCPSILKLVKNACDSFTINYDNSGKTYYIKVVPYESAYTQQQIADLSLTETILPILNTTTQQYTLDMSDMDDGMYLMYLMFIENEETEPIKNAVIVPIYKLCAMEQCMDKLIKAILCMCDCPDGNDCDPELELQYRYKLNKLFSILSPVQQLMMLRVAMDGQVINFDTDLLQKYYDLGLMIKKMNLMIDRCGLCSEEIEDCGCNG